MYNLLLRYNESQSLPTLYSLYPADYNGSNPALYDGFWSAWKEVEPNTNYNALTLSNVRSQVVVDTEPLWNSGNMVISCLLLMITAMAIINVLRDVWTQRTLYEKIA